MASAFQNGEHAGICPWPALVHDPGGPPKAPPGSFSSRRFCSSGGFATERIPKCGSFPNVMATRFEDQPWHQEWREALDRVIAAQMRRDSAKLGTPEREAANREHEAALVVFRALAEKIRPRSS